MTFDSPVTRVLMADVVTLTGRVRNLSAAAWQVGDGPGRWSVAGYVTGVGQRSKWLRELRTSPPECQVAQNDELEFSLRIDTGGLPSGTYDICVDMLMEGRYWMDVHGAVPASATLRIETFSHEIAVDADAVTLSPGRAAVLRGTVRKTCSKPWPEGAGGEPLKVGARLWRPSPGGDAVRDFRAHLARLPTHPEDVVAFDLVLDSAELQPGPYELSIDVVKEGQFWLADKGATARRIPVAVM